MNLNTPAAEIAFISTKRAAMLEKLGVSNAKDMLELFPRSYENRGEVRQLTECPDGEVSSVIVQVDALPIEKYAKNGKSYIKAVMSDESALIYVTFFNMKWIKAILVPGKKFRLYGRITLGLYGREAINPILETVIEKYELKGILPVYPLTNGLTQNIMRNIAEQVIPLAESIPELFPHEFLKEFLLIPRNQAYRSIHFPYETQALKSAQRRLAFEELLLFQLTLRLSKKSISARNSFPVKLKNTGIRKFFESLLFSLTSAQERVIKDIVTDLAKNRPMTRLVQGDVGSGKTIVAAAAMFITVKNGFQTALMAPTEILAAQHFFAIKKLFSGFDISVCLLSGSLSAAEKKHIKAEIASGEVQVIIGTNAIIQKGVEFKNLALTVTDEQHRFGVVQRAALTGKGGSGFVPHTLVMSATPIPRTLSLILYGDLEVSLIDELPPGRQYIETRAYNDSSRSRVYGFIKKQIASGHQIYIVCPLVEESEILELKSAEEHEKTIKEIFKGVSCGLLHGRMPSKKKTEIMTEFKEGRISVLITTTVVEVGVDVPNATVMVVENAERFGLSTLHQLRGRVGRGKTKSYCILMYDKRSAKAEERLDIMCHTNNGFEIAETDLKLRGPGEFFGERQSGEIKFKIANIADMELVTQTRYAADAILTNNSLENPEYSELLNLVKITLKSFESKNIIN